MIGELVEEYAIGTVLSETNKMTYAALVEHLEQNNIPKEITVCGLYENLHPQELLEVLEEHYDVYDKFAKQLMEMVSNNVVSGG